MENNVFEYTYSARRQQEVEEIRKAYLPKEEDKMDQLRRLHSIPTRKARTISLTVGLIGAMILGTGMSLCMTELGALLGDYAMAVGILIGLLGMVLSAAAYPVYHRTLQTERQKIAPDIMKLADELMQ